MRVATGFVSLGLMLAVGMGGCGGESFNAGDDDDPAGRGGNGSGNAGKAGTGGSSNPGSSGSSHAGSAAAGRGSGTGGGLTGTGGGSSVAGTGASSGSGNTSGSSNTGGSGSAGGTAGSAGEPAGGAGGQPADICQEPADSGPCEAAFERWFFNAARGICETFTYGGCEGNENNFETLEACSTACAGHGETDPTACDNPTECVVTAAHCCGGNMPPTLGDVTAVNAQSLQDFSAPCQLVDCASTIGPIPAHFGATCSNGHCRVFDARAAEFTHCQESSECYLRNGLSCCAGCGANTSGFVAVRSDESALHELVCGNVLVDCDACAPVPPVDMEARCVEGACTVVAVPGGG